ncbi:hypothetical protein [Cohaesibacter gelatinilyticus]|uniref:Uncharacterized protein n=1 Tax=Cohaesibacter gelatinilyticus TaxID=372072 RepID=A0A285PJ39_9HYPH|nr:hypothetical protein [Cohaesibacter gelatinilyticus]SNZ20146.1 hypothetical protein SAMN06265368_3249 [Cohaesibacter gelatinilyticus]
MQAPRHLESGHVYRHVYLVDSRARWSEASAQYDATQDLVLTYDLGLYKEIGQQEGVVHFIDYMCHRSVMEENNFRMYNFFYDWHYDASNEDIFTYKGIGFGFAFRIEVWNDYTTYVRTWLCLSCLKSISFDQIYLGSGLELVADVLNDIGLQYTRLTEVPEGKQSSYYFPSHRWMDEKLRSATWRKTVKQLLFMTVGTLTQLYDSFCRLFYTPKRIFVHEYHPTRALMAKLQDQPGKQVVQAHFTGGWKFKNLWRDRPIPVYGSVDVFDAEADKLCAKFLKHKSARLDLTTGNNIAEGASRVLLQRVRQILPRTLMALDCVMRYMDKNPLDLVVLIANIGVIPSLVHAVAEARGTPSYMIINGLLINPCMDEAKYATLINSYGPSIRDHYFRGMDNVIPIGDPRMDSYAESETKAIDRQSPTITIGASGFNSNDLNSYQAVEFAFLHDILQAVQMLVEAGTPKPKIIVKVRPNGYQEIYEQLVAEYFPGIVDVILDTVSIRELLDSTDLYISIYSQTLMEASCLGIPAIFHKRDHEFMYPPFDGQSEVVTTHSAKDVLRAIQDFMSSSDRFDAFLQRETLEKYIGPLDGKSLERNLKCVDRMLEEYPKNGISGIVSDYSVTVINADG